MRDLIRTPDLSRTETGPRRVTQLDIMAASQNAAMMSSGRCVRRRAHKASGLCHVASFNPRPNRFRILCAENRPGSFGARRLEPRRARPQRPPAGRRHRRSQFAPAHARSPLGR